MRALAVLALVLASGCAAPAAAPALTTIPWGITQCAFAIASIPVDPAALEARLPRGFHLAPGRLAAAPAGPRATIDLDVYACASGVGLNGTTIAPLAYGSHYASVTPPDALREKGYDAYFVKWDPLVPDAARRDLLAHAGLRAHDGTASVTINGPAVQAALSFSDGGGFSLSGTMQPPGAPGSPLPFMEFTPLADKASLARWHARLHDASIGQGAGVVQLARGSWVRDLVGADEAPATFIAGTWNLDSADASWPIPWP